MRSSEMERLIQKVLNQLNEKEMTLDEITVSTDYPEKRLVEAIRFLSDNRQIVIRGDRIRKK